MAVYVVVLYILNYVQNIVKLCMKCGNSKDHNDWDAFVISTQVISKAVTGFQPLTELFGIQAGNKVFFVIQAVNKVVFGIQAFNKVVFGIQAVNKVVFVIHTSCQQSCLCDTSRQSCLCDTSCQQNCLCVTSWYKTYFVSHKNCIAPNWVS